MIKLNEEMMRETISTRIYAHEALVFTICENESCNMSGSITLKQKNKFNADIHSIPLIEHSTAFSM